MRLLLIVLILFVSRIAFSQPSDAPTIKLLQDAITQGNDSLITHLCTESGTFKTQRFGRKLQSAVHVAASAHQKKIVQILVYQCKLDPSELDNTHTPPLYYARMNPGTVETLLELGADPNQMVKGEPLPIISQFLINTVPRQSLDAFLKHGVDLTLKSTSGMTPLMYAVRTKRKESIEFLMAARKQGHDIAPNELFQGKSISQLAIPDIAEMLREYGIE